jgi:antibiotic biosynthesis monooxygenase (ABM) superfamily enzyme
MTVSIVTQTCVRPDRAEDFARWQGETSTVISTFPDFIEQRLTPPNPPLQVDWVILQRFKTIEGARNWLGSAERQRRLEGATPMLVGRDDVHIVQDGASAARTAPVSAVISTRVRPGKEAEYLIWEHKIAAAQSKAAGLQGYRFEPAVPGVQDDFVAILRFDSEANLNKWLGSPERKALVDEAAPLTEEFHTRTVQTGFEQWFRDATGDGGRPAVWKMDAIVLVLLYPIVFLWNVWFGFPILTDKLHMGFAPALFLGNVFSVGATGFLVPWLANRLTWWLAPDAAKRTRMNLLGGGLMLVVYAAMVLAFWKLF